MPPVDLKTTYPWIKTPLIIQAPMRPFATAPLAVAVSRAGGFGFLCNIPGRTSEELATAAESFGRDPLPSRPAAAAGTQILPIGVGYLVHSADIEQARAEIGQHRPAAVWLFAPSPPSRPQATLRAWADMIRACAPDTAVWVQVGSALDAVQAVRECAVPADSATAAQAHHHPPLTVVVQGVDAGGHGLLAGAGLVALFPEVADALAAEEGGQQERIALIAAGGVSEARGAASALALGASGVALGTRFLASQEIEAPAGFRASVVAARDGGQTTFRTRLFDRLRGTKMGGDAGGWPETYGGRGLHNVSSTEYELAGEAGFDELKRRFDDAQAEASPTNFGPQGRDVTYVGTGVGLIDAVLPAADIVEKVRSGAVAALKAAAAAAATP